MQYISPASLFGEGFQLPPDKKTVQLERKKLLADLELNDSESIVVHNIVLTKNDIIRYCEELLQEEVAAWHAAIEKDTALLNFLERATIDFKEKFRNSDLYNDPHFIIWVSPYFAASCKVLIERCFAQEDNFSLGTLLNDQLLMTTSDIERCWQFVERILIGNIELIAHYAEQDKGANDSIPLENVSYLMNFGQVRLVELLPEIRFGELRNRYAFTIMQACIYAFNKNIDNRVWAKIAIENAIDIAAAAELKQDISAKLQEMNTITDNAGKKNWSFSFNWRVGLFLVYIVIKIATCNNDYNSTPTFSNSQIYYTQPRDSSVHLNSKALDSVMGSTPSQSSGYYGIYDTVGLSPSKDTVSPKTLFLKK